MAVIKAFDDNAEAIRELVRAKDDFLVYHTGKEKIEVEIKQILGLDLLMKLGVIIDLKNLTLRIGIKQCDI